MVDEIRATSSLRFFTRARYEEISDDYAWPPCLTTEPIPPEREDHMFLDALRRLDASMAAGADYDDWEEDFFTMQEICCNRYHHWLQAKGVPETYSNQFPFCIETYLSFIYQYDAGKLKDVPTRALAEFFMDYLLRKVMVKPPEYTYWPPALRLFYRFLAEKGYLDNPAPMMARLRAIEPDFMTLLKKRT